MLDYESMTIEQLKTEGDRVEGVISGLRQESRARAAVLDRKLKLQPILAAGQVIKPNANIIDQLKALPPAIFEQAKEFFAKGEK